MYRHRLGCGPCPGSQAAIPASSGRPPRREWEKVMQGAGNFYCKDVTKVHRNLITKRTTTETGEVLCMKPNMARLRLEKKADPNDSIAYICTGREVYEYDGNAKIVTEYRLAKREVDGNPIFNFLTRAFAAENRVFDPLSGAFKADGVADRFEIKLSRQDRNYVYLELVPRLPRDKGQFQSITLVLYQPAHRKQAYLPARIRIIGANGDHQDDWLFREPVMNSKNVTPAAFEFVEPPPGWKTLRPGKP
ncbi:MAG TPA: TIGR03009 domain-containing protein [Fimbriiglobus sp.]|nr:TIGR03009 domain-containing protein [Fimbriiglobus sp.]